MKQELVASVQAIEDWKQRIEGAWQRTVASVVEVELRHPTSKNFCKVNGKWRKFEPIYFFRKPA